MAKTLFVCIGRSRTRFHAWFICFIHFIYFCLNNTLWCCGKCLIWMEFLLFAVFSIKLDIWMWTAAMLYSFVGGWCWCCWWCCCFLFNSEVILFPSFLSLIGTHYNRLVLCSWQCWFARLLLCVSFYCLLFFLSVNSWFECERFVVFFTFFYNPYHHFFIPLCQTA